MKFLCLFTGVIGLGGSDIEGLDKDSEVSVNPNVEGRAV